MAKIYICEVYNLCKVQFSSFWKALKDGMLDWKNWTWNVADKIRGRCLKNKRLQSSRMVLTGFSKEKDSRSSDHSCVGSDK